MHRFILNIIILSFCNIFNLFASDVTDKNWETDTIPKKYNTGSYPFSVFGGIGMSQSFANSYSNQIIIKSVYTIGAELPFTRENRLALECAGRVWGVRSYRIASLGFILKYYFNDKSNDLRYSAHLGPTLLFPSNGFNDESLKTTGLDIGTSVHYKLNNHLSTACNINFCFMNVDFNGIPIPFPFSNLCTFNFYYNF